MMTDNNGALFPLSKNFLGTVKDPAWTVSNLCVVQLYSRKQKNAELLFLLSNKSKSGSFGELEKPREHKML